MTIFSTINMGAEILDYLWAEVTTGRESRRDIVENTLYALYNQQLGKPKYFEAYSYDEIERVIKQNVDDFLRRYYRIQSEWEPVTNNDQLDLIINEFENKRLLVYETHCIVDRNFTGLDDSMKSSLNGKNRVSLVYFFQQAGLTEQEEKIGRVYIYLIDEKKSFNYSNVCTDFINAIKAAGFSVETENIYDAIVAIQNFIWKKRRVVEL